MGVITGGCAAMLKSLSPPGRVWDSVSEAAVTASSQRAELSSCSSSLDNSVTEGSFKKPAAN